MLRFHAFAALAATSLSLSATAVRADDKLGLKVPAGFEVTQFAGDDLAHDIYALTIDSRGRVVVAGDGYIKTLHDTDGDGKADKATLFARKPLGGAQGLYFDGNDLLCSGDGGLLRLQDSDGDGVANDQRPSEWKQRNPEHGVHSVVKGPDGWFYIICGNDSGITDKNAQTLTSPVKQPKAGAVLRLPADRTKSEIYAHGFRNPYDFDFAPGGELLTVDSDNERDQYLPWYTPTRLLDVAAGQEHGWLQRGWEKSWSRPAAYLDSAPRLAELGRGSPTGLTVYRHRAFPEKYRGGVFSACWTLGKIYFLPLTRKDSSYATKVETFLEATGQFGFAPVDMAVDPQGDLYVAIGGRGTQGGVFRIRYKDAVVGPAGKTPLERVVLADEPLSSWSRAKWVPAAKELGEKAFEDAALDEKLPDAARIRALEVLTEVFGGVKLELAAKLAKSARPEVVARTAWALGRGADSTEMVQLVATLTHHADVRVQRAAWESIATMYSFRQPPPDLEALNALNASLNLTGAAASPDRRVRIAMLNAARIGGVPWPLSKKPAYAELLAQRWLAREPWTEADFRAVAAGLPTAGHLKHDAIRLLAVGLGDLTMKVEPEGLVGYVAAGNDDALVAARKTLTAPLVAAFPTADAELNRELARTLALLGTAPPELFAKLAAQWTTKSDPVDDVHYLLVAARLDGNRSPAFTKASAKALLALSPKMQKLDYPASRNWPLVVGEAFEEMTKRDAALPKALADDPAFRHPDHALFIQKTPKAQQEYAARKLFTAIKSANADWTIELVAAFNILPPGELFPVLREQWEEPGLRDTIGLVLAERPQAEDRARLFEVLSSVQPLVVQKAAGAIAKFPERGTPAEIRRGLQALRTAMQIPGPQGRTARIALSEMLLHIANTTTDFVEPEKNANLPEIYGRWFKWFATAHPKEFEKLAPLGSDSTAWLAREAKIKWDAGDAKAGKTVFEKRQCAACHVGGGKLGPDLKGIGTRLKRADLMVAIVDPNRDVADPYQTTQVTAKDGTVHRGIMVYESPDAVIVQIGPGALVRLFSIKPGSLQKVRLSLMPNGLLNGATDEEVANLFAYLKTL